MLGGVALELEIAIPQYCLGRAMSGKGSMKSPGDGPGAIRKYQLMCE
jgi:hypothetical protein